MPNVLEREQQQIPMHRKHRRIYPILLLILKKQRVFHLMEGFIRENTLSMVLKKMVR